MYYEAISNINKIETLPFIITDFKFSATDYGILPKFWVVRSFWTAHIWNKRWGPLDGFYIDGSGNINEYVSIVLDSTIHPLILSIPSSVTEREWEREIETQAHQLNYKLYGARDLNCLKFIKIELWPLKSLSLLFLKFQRRPLED